jgi:MoaA/NifB/PqqE/SkfB family radical SAM enzyme
MAQYALSSRNARKLRKEAEERGEHIPPFLIASITSSCNLHCSGCYARANHSCHEDGTELQLTEQQWQRIFDEAKELGIGFILLAGGEPMVRRDVIKAAGRRKSILFPIFTNGTMFDDDYIALFAKDRNLLPVISLEGDEEKTDLRRGKGVYRQLKSAMQRLQEKQILFGTSITVTKENLKNTTEDSFVRGLYQDGCKAVFYIEYVPVSKETKGLAPQEEDREILNEKLLKLRQEYEDMLFISFPGDEKTSGGCLAAGRGFFHINSQGGAEPCPFSPYSDMNLKNNSLREALNSPLFRKLKAGNLLTEHHDGGCVLFEKEAQVLELMEG